MQNVFNFFVMFYKDFLEYVHKAIMKEVEEKVNPHPSRLRGRGVDACLHALFLLYPAMS